MAGVDSDDELISLARQKTGATRVNQHPRSALKQELDEVRREVTSEVESALQGGTVDLYEKDAIFQMAKNLFFLRVAERRRRKEGAGNASGGVVPEKEIPEGIGRLRRHSFENSTLGRWRDEMVRGYNRLTK